MGCSKLAPCIPVLIFYLLFWLNSPVLRKQHVTLVVIALHYDVRVHHPYACLHLPHEISFLQLFQRGCHRLPAAPCALHDLLVSGGKAQGRGRGFESRLALSKKNPFVSYERIFCFLSLLFHLTDLNFILFFYTQAFF